MSVEVSAKTVTYKGTNPPNTEEVRTLFVTGLTKSVTQSSLANLFGAYEGYEGAFINMLDYPNKLIVFATFSTRKEAARAKNDLDGCVILSTKERLHVQFAHSTSRQFAHSTSCEHPNHFHNYVEDLCNYEPQSGKKLPARHFIPTNPRQMSVPSSHACSRSQMTWSDQHPCTTLFVGNLEPQSTWKDLTTAFSRCKGFLRARINSNCLNAMGSCKYNVGFVEFKDLRSSHKAMCKMQGYILPGSHRNSGIRIEYAREKMRWGNIPSIPQSSATDSPGHNPKSSVGECMTHQTFPREEMSPKAETSAKIGLPGMYNPKKAQSKNTTTSVASKESATWWSIAVVVLGTLASAILESGRRIL